MKTTLATVYYFGLGDCTNGGASSRHGSIIVIDEKDIEEAKKSTIEQDRIFVLVKRQLWDKPHWYLRQLHEPKGKLGPMMGGNYAKIENTFYPIHDRYESQEEYDFLSR